MPQLQTPTSPAHGSLTSHSAVLTPTHTLPTSREEALARLRFRPVSWNPGEDIVWSPNNPVATMVTPRVRPGLVFAGQNVFLIGGGGPDPSHTLDTAESIDLDSFQKSPLPLMHLPHPWSGGVAVRMPAGNIHAFPAWSPPGGHYEWVPSDGLWHTRPPVPEKQLEPTGVIGPDGKVYLIGGRSSENGGTQVLKTVQRFDPNNGTWETVSSLDIPRFRALAATAGNKIYVFGGFFDFMLGLFACLPVEEYDPGQDNWKSWDEDKSRMPTRRWGCATVTYNGRIYLIGGSYSCTSVSDAVEEFNPEDKTWRALTPMPTARTGAVAVATTDGRILVFGGMRRPTYSASLGQEIDEWGITDVIEEGTLPIIFPQHD